MTDRNRGNVHGWLVLDKPQSMSSAAAVGKVRRAMRAGKAGHGGTLDPLATGVLPIALGEATKTAGYVVDGHKLYRFTVRWGEQRNTDDAEGTVMQRSDVRPSAEAIEAALHGFHGEIEQVPPQFSAIKVAGERAYVLARSERPVTLAARRAFIERIVLVDVPDRDTAEFEVVAGKGVYMRAIARDLALALGTVGYIIALRRLAVGPFTIATAISLDKLESMGHSDELVKLLLPVGSALAGIPALTLTEAEARRLQHGQPIAVLPVTSRSCVTDLSRGAVVCAMAEGKPVALARIAGAEIRPVRILNL